MVGKNIILSGLSGSGKTTVGRMLAKMTGRAFIDLDVLIEESTGMTIPEIFKNCKEEGFREIESRLTKRVSLLKNTVIALGGGTLTRRRNYEYLKENGMIVFLDVSLDTLILRLEGDCSRPLLEAQDLNEKKEKLSRLYRERIKTYRETADIVINGDDSPENIAVKILKKLPLDDTKILPVEGESVFVKIPSKSYCVKIGYKILPGALTDFLKEQKNISKIVMVTSPLINRLFCTPLKKAAEKEGFYIDTVLIEDEEDKKNLSTVSKIYDKFIELDVDRNSLVIAVGGGITGDMAGFAAATYMRGIRWVYVPTTLLSQVDASIGGKVAVNHSAGKNLIGAFYQPEMVISDTALLETLPDRIFSDGMAEVVKTAVIDGDLFYFLESNACKIKERDPKVLLYTVTACTRLKSRIVEEDEHDRGARMLLNLGHTFGHAVEAAAGYDKISHGQAVSVGMVMALKLSNILGNEDGEMEERVRKLLSYFDLPISLGELPKRVNGGEILSYLRKDKKAIAGKLRFVVPYGLGDVRIIEGLPGNPDEILRKILKEMEEGAYENTGDSRAES